MAQRDGQKIVKEENLHQNDCSEFSVIGNAGDAFWILPVSPISKASLLHCNFKMNPPLQKGSFLNVSKYTLPFEEHKECFGAACHTLSLSSLEDPCCAPELLQVSPRTQRKD